MNDDRFDPAPAPAGPSRRRAVALAAAVGVAGLVAGGVAAGAISAASADTGDTGGRPGHGVPRGYAGAGHDGDPSRPMRSDETLLTGATKEKVLAAVQAEYPDATVQRVETDSDGVYEAHIVDDGEPLTVLLDKSFEITGTQAGGPGGGHGDGQGGPGRHGPGEGPGEPGSSAEDSGYRQS